MYSKPAPEKVCTEETRTNICVCTLSLASGLPREIDGVISIWVQFSRGVGSQPLFQVERPSLFRRCPRVTSTIKCESEQEGVVFPRRKHYEHASTTTEGEDAHWTQGQDLVVLRDADRSAHTGALVLIVCSSDTKRKCRATRSGGGTTGLVRLRNRTHLVTHSDEFTCG